MIKMAKDIADEICRIVESDLLIEEIYDRTKLLWDEAHALDLYVDVDEILQEISEREMEEAIERMLSGIDVLVYDL